jgi:prephenate dehydrogenase
MAVKIAIIGLGKVGASIGMALADHKEKLLCVGHDLEISVENEARKLGAVEKTEHNLPRAVQDAKVVILSLPASEIKKTLEFIAPDLSEGALVVDTSPVKSQVAKWVKEILPAGVDYVGILPTIGGEFLRDGNPGLASAKADLFVRSIFLVSAPPGTSGDNVQVATELVRLIGATPILSDISESDGLATNAYLLPQLVSAAFLNMTVDQPGWSDSRKLTDRPYYNVTAGAEYETPESLQVLSLQNKDNVVRGLDTLIASLSALRDDIESGNEARLQERLKAAHEGQANWLIRRTNSEWDDFKQAPAEYYSVGERLFGGWLGKKPKK